MLSGPEISPRSKNKPKKLVIFLHGVGADGQNIADFCHMLNRCVEDTYFLCPNGPFDYDMGIGGYQWFSLQDRTEEILLQGIDKALPIVNQYINYHLDKLGLTNNDLAIMGFSQGCMMALHLGLRRSTPPACVIGFSGALPGGKSLKKDKVNHPPIILSHGDEDFVVEIDKMYEAEKTLTDLGIKPETYIFEGLPHAMHEGSFNLAVEKLKEFLFPLKN